MKDKTLEIIIQVIVTTLINTLAGVLNVIAMIVLTQTDVTALTSEDKLGYMLLFMIGYALTDQGGRIMLHIRYWQLVDILLHNRLRLEPEMLELYPDLKNDLLGK